MNAYILQTPNKQIFGVLQTNLTIGEVNLWFEKFKLSGSYKHYCIEDFIDYLIEYNYDKNACGISTNKTITIEI